MAVRLRQLGCLRLCGHRQSQRSRSLTTTGTEEPECIAMLTGFSSTSSAEDKTYLLSSAHKFSQLRTHQQWVHQELYLSQMSICIGKLKGEGKLGTHEIMKLVETVRYCSLSPKSRFISRYLQKLADKYALLPTEQRSLSPRDLVSLMTGMSALTLESKPLQKMVQSALPDISSWSGVMRGREPFYVLVGMRGLDARSQLSRLFVAALGKHVQRAEWDITDKRVRCLSGFQRMTDETPEVRDLFHFICEKILSDRNGSFDSTSVGTALLGLMGKDCCHGAAERVFYMLLEEMDEICYDSSTSADQLAALLRRAAVASKKINMSDVMSADIELIISRLQERLKLKARDGQSIGTRNRKSELESETIAKIEKRIRADGRVSLSSNEYIQGFETDIIFRVPNMLVPEFDTSGNRQVRSLVVNIEIDGPQHRVANNRFLDSLRDEYLHDQHKVVVVRISFDEINNTNMTIANIMDLVIKQNPFTEPLLADFAPVKEDFGDSFKMGKKCRGKNVRYDSFFQYVGETSITNVICNLLTIDLFEDRKI